MRRPRFLGVVSAGAAVLATAGTADAGQFIVATPPAGTPTVPYWRKGNPYTIQWSGGPPGPVTLSLIDVCAWTVKNVIVASTPNTGRYTWMVPNALECGLFQVYIQDVRKTTWTYSTTVVVIHQ